MIRQAARLGTLLAPLFLLLASCGGGEPEAPTEAGATITPEAFIAVYVDLRVAALRSPEGEISDEERDRVLERHGVTEEDLLHFVEAHGRNPELMREVWLEVEERLDSLSQEQTGGEEHSTST